MTPVYSPMTEKRGQNCVANKPRSLHSAAHEMRVTVEPLPASGVTASDLDPDDHMATD